MAEILKSMREKIANLSHGIFRWAMNALMPEHRVKTSSLPKHCDKHVGVACTLCSPLAHIRAEKVLRLYDIQQSKSSSFSWPSSSSSSHDKSPDGDILGSESGVHMYRNQDVQSWGETKPYVLKEFLQGRMYLTKKRDIPPPISILRKNVADYGGPLPLSPCSDDEDGRFELGKNGIENCEYLVTIRENSRLIMKLVTMNNSTNSSNTWDLNISED